MSDDDMSKCLCGHVKLAHIYEEGACRPGYTCPNGCTEYYPVGGHTLVDETVTVDGVVYTADRVREIVRERHALATELALCREEAATLRQQLDGACRAIVNAQVH